MFKEGSTHSKGYAGTTIARVKGEISEGVGEKELESATVQAGKKGNKCISHSIKIWAVSIFKPR